MLRLVLLLPLLTACASKQYQNDYGPFPKLTVTADSAITRFLEDAARAPRERVHCLYGFTRRDTAFIAFLRPALMRESTETTAKYEACPILALHLYGLLRYVGTYHNHPNGVCGFSATDSQSFYASRPSIIDLVGCNDGVISRHK